MPITIITAEFYGHEYIVGKECKFEWAGECTPYDCNFVYCEHNKKKSVDNQEKRS